MAQGKLEIGKTSEGKLLVTLSGSWQVTWDLPSPMQAQNDIDSFPETTGVAFDTEKLEIWDSSLLTFLQVVIGHCTMRGIAVHREGLPNGVNRLLDLAGAVPEQKGASKETRRSSFLDQAGEAAITLWRSNTEMLTFIGESFVAFMRLFSGKSRFRGSDLLTAIQECSAEALPIVSLISLLVGLILAFVGSIQLKLFGAQIFVADLVGIGMVRAMGAIMTGIIMAGRTGASYAATIGTMQVNEEIDALQTTGVSPIDFLVLPRMLALSIIMPLLVIYADLMGILGGLIVGVFILGLNPVEYYNETIKAVSLTNFWIGLVSGLVYGTLVALSGCMRGMQCGRSASAVGEATTSAVVTGIVSIIVATAVITVICNILAI